MVMASERRSVYRRTEDIYRKAIEDIRDYAIFTMDRDGLVTNWNTGAQHILGYTEAEIVGKDAAKFFTAEDRAKNAPAQELSTAATVGRAEDDDGTCDAMVRVSGPVASSPQCATRQAS